MRTLVWAICVFGIFSSAGAMDLKEAFLDKELEVTIRGLDYSQIGYDDKDIWIGVLNLKGHPVTITVDPGFILSSEEGDVQDMIITEPLEMIASTEYFNETAVQAMCIQSGNKSPGDENKFIPNKYAGGNLGALAKFVYEHNYQNHMGQGAMWVLSDEHSIYDISGYAEEANPIRQFVADLTGSAFDTSLVDKQVKYIDRTIKEYALYLKFYLDRREDIKLQVYNQKGEFDRDLMIRPNQEAGRYDMRYKISLFGMVGEKYYVRLFVGEEMRNEFTLVIKES